LHVDHVEHVGDDDARPHVYRVGACWCVQRYVDVLFDHLLRRHLHDDYDNLDDDRRGLGWWWHDDDRQQLDDAAAEHVLPSEPE